MATPLPPLRRISWHAWVVGAVVAAVVAAGAGAAAGAVSSPLAATGPGYGGDADGLHLEQQGDGIIVTGYGFLAGSTVTVTAGDQVVTATVDGVGGFDAEIARTQGSAVVEVSGTSPDLEPISRRETTW
jgi:hypothetical protein